MQACMSTLSLENFFGWQVFEATFQRNFLNDCESHSSLLYPWSLIKLIYIYIYILKLPYILFAGLPIWLSPLFYVTLTL